MDKKIIDGMKNEGIGYKFVMIFGYIMMILMPVSIYLMNNEKFSLKDIVLLAIAWFIVGTFGLYGWLYAVKYRLEFNDEKVYLKTLFKKVEINISDVTKYTCNRYMKSVFFQFKLFTNEKKVLINTRYKDEFELILKFNNIEQMSK